MIGARIDAALRAFRDPAIVRDPEVLKTEAFMLVDTTMEKALKATLYGGPGWNHDWGVGAMAAYALMRGQLKDLHMELLMEMAYPKEDRD